MKNTYARFTEQLAAASPEEIEKLDEKLEKVRANFARLQRLLYRLPKNERDKFFVVLLTELQTLGLTFTTRAAMAMKEDELDTALRSGSPETLRRVSAEILEIVQERD